MRDINKVFLDYKLAGAIVFFSLKLVVGFYKKVF